MRNTRMVIAGILCTLMICCMSGSIYVVEGEEFSFPQGNEDVKDQSLKNQNTENENETDQSTKNENIENKKEIDQSRENKNIENKNETDKSTENKNTESEDTDNQDTESGNETDQNITNKNAENVNAKDQNIKNENTEGKSVDASIQISAPSALLMEASTGTVLFEQDADAKRPPASVTKVMTMLLIFDAVDSGKISLEDKVPVSEFAASMGGSQVFLEPGEMQTVDTMLKCISIASANDACVAMAEYISGSEEAFVQEMNKRAKALGMHNTNFVNCNGLDAEGHVTTARDIALMSRELITKYPQVHEYAMTWMENITHETKKGASEFGLTNTNKLVRQYEYATGLKTGSTGEAKFCVSATGKKDDVELIAVVMAAETSKERFSDAVKMMNYGFGKCQVYSDEQAVKTKYAVVKNGVGEHIEVERGGRFTYLDVEGRDMKSVKKTEKINKKISAPINKGDVVGAIIYTLDGNEIGRSDIIAKKGMPKARFSDYLKKVSVEFLIEKKNK